MVVARRQTLVQLSDELIAALDERAARRHVSRSQLIRAAIDRAIVEGYTRIPPGELDAWAEAATIESIRDEPW